MNCVLHTDLSGDRGVGPIRVVVKDAADVGSWSEEQQAQFGDCLMEPVEEVLQGFIHIKINNADIVKLQAIRQDLTDEEYSYCWRKSGEICKILNVPVDYQVVKAFMFFWDPRYRCFTLSDQDLVPIIEEYSAMLWPNGDSPNKVYAPDLEANPNRSLANLLNMRAAEVRDMLKSENGTKPLTLDMLVHFINVCTAPEHMERKMNAFILAIYGTMVFPTVVGQIDKRVIVFCDKMIRHNLNPVPVILAETLTALSYCRRNGKVRLHCCVQMLYVWILSHIAETGRRFTSCYFTYKNPLNDAAEISLETKGMWKWVDYFRKLVGNGIMTRAKWMPKVACLYQCGEQPWVPLMGYRNLVSYAPSLGLRQLGSCQYVPCTRGLDQVECCYDDPNAVEVLNQAKTDWKVLIYVRQEANFPFKSDKYQEWHTTRYKALFIPETPSVGEKQVKQKYEEVRVPQPQEAEPSELQRARELAAKWEQEYNQMKANYQAEVHKGELSDEQHRQAEDSLKENLGKMNKRREYVLGRSQHWEKLYRNKTREVERMAQQMAEQKEKFKGNNAQWQSLLLEEQRQHQKETEEKTFYQQEVERVKREQAIYVEMSMEREAELEACIKEKKKHEELVIHYRKKSADWQWSFEKLQRDRDDKLRIIQEQVARLKDACEDSIQFCKLLKSEA